MNTDEPKLDYRKILEKVESRFKEICEKWHKRGETAYKIYLGDEEGIPFNILYSNTETIVPAVFSRKPIARVTRRFDESRSDIPAKIVQRMLTFCMDTNMPSYPSFMRAVEDAVMDAAVPGQGLFRVRKVNNLPVLDLVEWNRFAWGFCTRWENCPWIAFAHDMTAGEVLETFSPKEGQPGGLNEAQVAELKLKENSESQDSELENTPAGEKRPSTVRVWEVWKRSDRSRCFVGDLTSDCLLARDEDPLGLEGFFPIPSMPLVFVHNTTDTLPRPLYRLYQEQALELNEITRRLKNVIKAIKVRGVYASGIDDIPKIFDEQDDNVLIPSQAAFNVMSQGKGLDAYIWLLPIEKLIIVAKELYAARESVKSVIYEILGIGDILRGVSKASETLGAQEIKDKWGSIRINKARERTAEFVREGLRLMAEVAVKHTPPEQWAQITGVQLAPPQQAAIAQNTGQQMDPMQTWPGVLGVLQNDLTRSYLIDIETNSTVDSEATQEKAEMAEFMNAFGQAMGGLREIMSSSAQGWELGKAILLGITAKFDLGEDLSPMLKALPAPAQGGDPAALQKAQQEIQKRMEEVAKKEQDLSSQERLLADTLTEIEKASAAVKSQQEKLAGDKSQLKKDHDNALTEIELTKRSALLEIEGQKVALEGQKAAFAGEKAAVAAQAKANQAQNRGVTPKRS